MNSFARLVTLGSVALACGCAGRLYEFEGTFASGSDVDIVTQEGTFPKSVEMLPLRYTYFIGQDGDEIKHGYWRVYNRQGGVYIERIYHCNTIVAQTQYWGGTNHVPLCEERTDGRLRQVTGFWRNGQKQYEYMLVDGKQNGTMSEWYANGAQRRSKSYILGAQDGREIGWGETGRKVVDRSWRKGLPYTGEFTLCYGTNGHVVTQEVTVNYLEGVPQAVLPDAALLLVK